MVRSIVSICILMLSAVAIACDGGDSEPEATPTPAKPGPLGILGEWVAENRTVTWIGDCAEAQEGIDVGKYCATLIGERGTLRAFSFGPTFSEGTALAILRETPDAWEILKITNRDPGADAAPGIPWPLQEGDRVVVLGLGENDCLRIRQQPSQSGEQITCVADGTVATVLEGPVEADTFVWWRLASEDFNGWAAENWLRLESEIQRLFQEGQGATAAPDGEQQEE